MVLTPDEILKHEFTKKGSRAYIASEVDSFLDQVNGDYETIITERDKLLNDNDQLQVKVDGLEAKREQVNQSIFVAQEAADRLRKEADGEVKKQLTHAQEAATKIISDARTKAEAEATSLAQENEGLIKEQNELRTEVENFKNSFLKLLELQRKLLENDDLAEAVHRLPIGQATADRIDKIAAIEKEPVRSMITSESEPDSTETENEETVPEQGPIVVFPEASENEDKKL